MLEGSIVNVLKKNFNLNSLFPYQELIIKSILDGDLFFKELEIDNTFKNQIVILPTGSGKSICFQLPPFFLKHLTVVVYPLLSLMNDQKRRMEKASLKVAELKGAQSKTQRKQIFDQLKKNEAQILITNAETITQKSVTEFLKTIPISLFVVDEAHTVTQWGETFRPSYLLLKETINQLKVNQLIAFTATASPYILKRIRELLFKDENVNIVYGNPDRPNIYYRSLPSLAKIHDLEFLAKDRLKRPLIVFCNSRKRCETVAATLQLRFSDIPIRFYHAGLSSVQRKEIENWFFEKEDAILISTKAYGMGLDKKNIRSAIHYDIPCDVESYLQESGRAGRDGSQAYSIILYENKDFLAKNKSNGFKRLLAIASDNENCKREAVLKQLNYTLEYCFGCDVCDNNIFNEADGQKEIIDLLFCYPFRFTSFEAIALFKGSKFSGYKWYGVFEKWYQDDITIAIKSLIQADMIRCTALPFFKGRLYLNYRVFNKQVCQRLSKLLRFFYRHRH